MHKSGYTLGFAVVLVAFGGLFAAEGDAKRTYRPMVPPANFSPPAIAVDVVDFDWGSVVQGEQVVHEYIVKNTGGSPLVVSQVKASCGCTTAKKPTDPIPPGGQDVVALKIDTRRFKGKIKKTASIYSNALPSPLTISIGGSVETLFEQTPPNPRYEVVRGVGGEPVKVTLSRNPGAEAKFRIVEATTESQILEPQITEVKPGELYEISVNADVGENTRKYFYEKLSLKIEVEGKGVVDHDVNVSVTVKDRIDVQPRTSVYFSRNDTKLLSEGTQKSVQKVLDIKSLAGADHKFKILGVTSSPVTTTATRQNTPAVPSDSQYFTTKVETVTPGKHYRLVVEMAKLPEGNVRTVRERLSIETDDPTVPALTVTAMAAVY